MSANKDGEAQSVNAGDGPLPASSEETAQSHSEYLLGRALFRVMRAIMFEDRPAAELDALPLAQLRLLWTVHAGMEATMKDFSERLGVSQSTVTQLADRLVKRGLIDRLADSSDRRVVRLRISAIGKSLLVTVDQERKRTLHALWGRLNETERDEALRGLSALGRAAEAVREAQGRPALPLPERMTNAAWEAEADGLSEDAQPVLDLMARRVRGHTRPA